jgi:protein-disulfide isomerase
MSESAEAGAAVSQPSAPVLTEHSLGNPDAPMTVVEFGDYECPYCAAAEPVLRKLVEKSDGQVRLVFKNFPLFEPHPHALIAALAAESTTASGRFWQMHRILFENQDRLKPDDLRRYAASVGSDPELAAGEAAQRFADIVQRDYAEGIQAGVDGTPTLFINGERYRGRVEFAALQRATGTAPGRGPLRPRQRW